MTGTLELICGPSGVGKSSSHPKPPVSYQYSTRSPRSHEVDGVDKRFVSKSEFNRGVQSGSIVGSHFYYGHRFGYASEIADVLRSGESVRLDVAAYEAVGLLENAFTGFSIRKNLLLAPFHEQEIRLVSRNDSSRTVWSELPNTKKFLDNFERFDTVRFHLFDAVYLEQRVNDLFLDAQERLIKVLYTLGCGGEADFHNGPFVVNASSNKTVSILKDEKYSFRWSYDTFREILSCFLKDSFSIVPGGEKTEINAVRQGGLPLGSLHPIAGLYFEPSPAYYALLGIVSSEQRVQQVKKAQHELTAFTTFINEKIFDTLAKENKNLFISRNDMLSFSYENAVQVKKGLCPDSNMAELLGGTVFPDSLKTGMFVLLNSRTHSYIESNKVLSNPVFTPALLADYFFLLGDKDRGRQVLNTYYGSLSSEQESIFRTFIAFDASCFKLPAVSDIRKQQRTYFQQYYQTVMKQVLEKHSTIFPGIDVNAKTTIEAAFLAKEMHVAGLDDEFIPDSNSYVLTRVHKALSDACKTLS